LGPAVAAAGGVDIDIGRIQDPTLTATLGFGGKPIRDFLADPSQKIAHRGRLRTWLDAFESEVRGKAASAFHLTPSVEAVA
jgi:hypothetical protein